MTMQGARRLATSAVVASLAVAGLSACRSEPSVAAYLGDNRITESRVQDVWDNARDAVAGAGPDAAGASAPASAGPAPMPITRSDVVRTLIGADVLPEVARKHNVTLPADLQLGEYATALHLPETTEYLKLYAQNEAYVRLLREGATSAPEPSDADYQEIFQVLQSSGQVPAGTTVEQFKTQLPAANKQLVQTAAEVRKEIAEVTAPMKIRVNPRYQPLGIAVLQFQTENGNVRPLVSVPLGKDTSAPVVPAS